MAQVFKEHVLSDALTQSITLSVDYTVLDVVIVGDQARLYALENDAVGEAAVAITLLPLKDALAAITLATFVKVLNLFDRGPHAVFVTPGAAVIPLGALAPLDTVGTAEIDDLAVTTAKLADDAVTADKIANLTIQAFNIDSGAVTSGKLGPSAVETTNIALNAVLADAIAANAVVTDKINNLAVTTAKIDDLAVTAGKLAAAVQADIDARVLKAGDTMSGDLNLDQNAIVAALLDPVASDPGTPSEGQVWFRTDLNRLRCYAGSVVYSMAFLTDTGGGGGGEVLEVDYNANTILAANVDDTPLALTIGPSTIVGRGAAGNIAALTAAQILTILGVETGATADQAWGDIAGTLSSQADLQAALDARVLLAGDTMTGTLETPMVRFSGGTGTQGEVSWNANEETLDLVNNGAVTQIGQETHVHIRNQSGAAVTDGEPVMITGTLGASGRILVGLMDGTVQTNAKYFLGLTTEPLGNNQDGKVTNFGKVRGIDTSGTPYGETWSDGDGLWVSPFTVGYLTNVEPGPAYLAQSCATVIKAHANQGTLMVRATGYDEHAFKLHALLKTGGAMTGPITTTSTFDGRDVAVDGTKLDGIATGADVSLKDADQALSANRSITNGGNASYLYTLLTDTTGATKTASHICQPSIPRHVINAGITGGEGTTLNVVHDTIDLTFSAGADLRINTDQGVAGDVVTSGGPNLPPIFAPGIVHSATAPDTSQLWYHTTDDILYAYDTSRTKWLSVHEEQYHFAISSTSTGNHILRQEGNLTAFVSDGRGRGVMHDITVTGWVWHVRGGGTSSRNTNLQKEDEAGTYSSAFYSSTPAGTWTVSRETDLNADFNDTDRIGVILYSGASAQDPRCSVTYRRRPS